ncbi:MAG: hypothetical protein V9E98_06965 [Candidatus Nanopelagicales bacterium]
MSTADFPQMWDLLPVLEPQTAEEAADVAAAELAAIGWTDRVRAMAGAEIRVGIEDRVVTGTVGPVFGDAVVILATDGQWLLPTATISWVRGPTRPARGPTGRQRASGASAAREWVGREVTAALRDGQILTEELDCVGADHIVLRGSAGGWIVPWSALRWLRCQ